jgi:excisionase family DNA binding protein
MSDSLRPFMTVGQLADALALSRTRAYQLVHDGVVPSTRWGGTIRIPRGAFEKWMAEHEREALASVRQEAPAP